MNYQVRPGHRLYRWIYAVAVGLAVLAVPHAVVVMSERLPGAWFTLHAATALGLFVYGELRRQEWVRAQACVGLSELVSAVEER
jgi:hypothetical protein